MESRPPKRRRPPIPAAIERQVLTEAGHRCAACGEPCPLERAHIRAWRKSREHSVDNLILLCASCHQRADLEHWGEKALRQYKERPWILRKALESQPKKCKRVVITLDMELEAFEEGGEDLLRFALAAFLRIKPKDVVIRSLEEGSVKITIDLPLEAGETLLKSYHNRDVRLMDKLEGLPIIGMEDRDVVFSIPPLPTPVFSLEKLIPSGWLGWERPDRRVVASCREVGDYMINLISRHELQHIHEETSEPSPLIRSHVNGCPTCTSKLRETRVLVQKELSRRLDDKRRDILSRFVLTRREQVRLSRTLMLELIQIWSPNEAADPGFTPKDGSSRSRRGRQRPSRSK